jgi:hypothetical protein
MPITYSFSPASFMGIHLEAVACTASNSPFEEQNDFAHTYTLSWMIKFSIGTAVFIKSVLIFQRMS